MFMLTVGVAREETTFFVLRLIIKNEKQFIAPFDIRFLCHMVSNATEKVFEHQFNLLFESYTMVNLTRELYMVYDRLISQLRYDIILSVMTSEELNKFT